MSRPRYRLMIEGAPVEWVTDSSLETTVADGRVRRQGLQYEGLNIREELDLRESTTNPAGITVQIRSEYADAQFARRADLLGFLAADIDYDDTSLELDTDTGLITVDDIVHMGTEALLVTSVSTTTIGITRQYWDTQAQGHFRQVDASTEYVQIVDRVPSYEGRRAYIFRYDEGAESDAANLFDFADSYQGATEDTADEVVYRGIISRPPSLDSDGLTWLLDIEPVTFLLEQEIATSEVELAVQGLYHHAFCGLLIYCDDLSVGTTPSVIRGYHPTVDEFLHAVNDALETLRTTAFTHDPQMLSFSVDSISGYRLNLTTHLTESSDLDVNIASPLIGATGTRKLLYSWINSETGQPASIFSLDPNTSYYKCIDSAATDAIFFKGYENISNEPGYNKCLLGATPLVLDHVFRDYIFDADEETTYPSNRLYIANDPGGALAVGSSVSFSGSTTYINRASETDYTVAGVVTAKGQHATYDTTYIDLTLSDTYPVPVTESTAIKLIGGYGEQTNIAGFIDNVIDQAVNANAGATPFLTYADIDAVSLSGLSVDAALLKEWNFRFSKSITLLEVIKEHLKLYRWFIHLNSVGRIAFAPFKPLTSGGSPTSLLINGDYIVTPPDGDFPRWTPAVDGVVNVVEIARGYDWVEDSFDDKKLVTVRDVYSISTHKNRSRGVTKIEIKNEYIGLDMPVEQCFELAGQYLSVHAHDYDVVEMDVTSDVFDQVVCGDIVRVTSPHIMDSDTGTRGITARIGYVIGREYSLDPSRGAKGKITVRINRDNPYGYAPAMRATNAAVYSGSVYTFTVEDEYHAPDGQYDTAYFTVGDLVRITEFKSASGPNSETGTITAINSTTEIRIDLDGALPASTSGIWEIEYQSDAGTLNAGQNNYCYVADSNGLLYNDTIGRRFA